jgi:hypothetical protein
VRVETVSLFWIVGTIDTVAVKQAWTRLWQIAMPYLIGLFAERDALELALAFRIE